MTTEAQVVANRSNAQKSTGPRTAQGKAAVAQNAVKHGLLAQEVVIKGEDPGEFELYRDGMLAELAPAGPMESLLAERIVGLAWRLRRAERLQAAAFDTLPEEKKKWGWSDKDNKWIVPQKPQPGSEAECLEFGERIVHDFAQTRILDRLLMYERRIEHSLYRTMAELRNLRKEQGVSSENKSVKCEVSSLKSESETSNRPVPAASNFTLPTSDSALECEVSSLKLENQASSPPGLPTSPFPLPTPGETPDGVTTNVPEAQGPSCETKPISRGVSSLKCQVSGEDGSVKCEVSSVKLENQASSPPTSNFTLPTSDSAVRACDEPPSGVTTNGAQAQGQASETKPISAGAIKDGEGYRPIFRKRR